MSPGKQNMKTRADALGTAENESERVKREDGTQQQRWRKTGKRNPTPSVSPKTRLGAQNMKTGPDALGTAEKESGRTKH
jgi:hypothetical protein